MAEPHTFIDVGGTLGTPYVRVFGISLVEGSPRSPQLAYIARGLRELGSYAHARAVTVLLESHGDFTDSPTLLEIMRLVEEYNPAILCIDSFKAIRALMPNPEEFRRFCYDLSVRLSSAACTTLLLCEYEAVRTPDAAPFPVAVGLI